MRPAHDLHARAEPWDW